MAQTGLPPAVLAWLQGILRERLHGDIVLEQMRPDVCTLALPGTDRRILLRSDFNVFERATGDLACGHWAPPERAWLPAGQERLPTPGLANPPRQLVTVDDQGCHLHYDVLGLAYWMLSRKEEIGSGMLDCNGRYPAVASHAWRHGYLDRPIVDEWFELLRGLMRSTWPGLRLRVQRPTMLLSHDVDTPARYGLISPWRLIGAMAIDLFRDRERDRAALRRAPWIWAASKRKLDPQDPFNSFDWIMDRAEEAGMRNAFYFICGHTDKRRDGHYFPEDPAIIDLMQRIHARGHEIGLHPSYHTYRDPAALRAEADRLRRTCAQAGIPLQQVGARMHYLRWETPTTLHGLESAGIAYDTTLGYADQPGFRCGTCHEYPAFDPVQCKALTLRIRPLIVMECTVMRAPPARARTDVASRLRHYMNACHRVNGCFTLLWHNTLLEHGHQRRLYERVIRHHQENKK